MYRGIKQLLNPSIYATGRVITWQARAWVVGVGVVVASVASLLYAPAPLHVIVAPTSSSCAAQAFSSSTKRQLSTLEFVNVHPGRRLQGSMFIIQSISAKDIRHFSQYPDEEEVLFPPNSQFRVQGQATAAQKRAGLSDLLAYDMRDLDVYLLEQTA